MTKRNLSEAAKEVLAASIAGAPADKFGANGGNVPNLQGGPQDLGGEDVNTVTPANAIVNTAAAAPAQATPPGATPPVGSEPMKKLGVKQPQDEVDANTTDIAPKKEGKTYTGGKLSEAIRAKMEEDVNAMFSADDLSEETKTKAKTIYEAAVMARVNELTEEMAADLDQRVNEEVETRVKEMTEKVNDYLNYVVENWMKENKVAIEASQRLEIADDFMAGIRNVFVENYIEIPESKVDLVGSLQSEKEEISSKLDEQIKANVELAKALAEAKKAEILRSMCEGLTVSQSEKIRELAATVDYENEASYKEKVSLFRESYTKTAVKPGSTEALNEGVEIEEVKPASTDVLVNSVANLLKSRK